MKNLAELNNSDFKFVFASQGASFLFEDLIVKYYIPNGESLTLCKDNKVRDYLSSAMIEQMNSEGLGRTSEQTREIISSLEKTITRTKEEIKLFKQDSDITFDQTKQMFSTLGSICKEYAYFDNIYWDLAYAQSYKNEVIRENIQLVQDYKNVLRAEMSLIFFDIEDSIGYMPMLLRSLGKMFSIPVEDISLYSESEVSNLFNGFKVSSEVLASRRLAAVFFKDETGNYMVQAGEEAGRFIDSFDKIEGPQTFFRGTVAHKKGKVQGKVITLPQDYKMDAVSQRKMTNMRQGDILVCETTNPDFISAMKKAGAILTDAGGLLSHAAITSRELDTPCIVGLGSASKLLLDEDMVEVDSENGIVKKLN